MSYFTLSNGEKLYYEDKGNGPELADWYRDHVKTSFRAVCFPDSNHMLVNDHPEKFAEEVSGVLQ